MDTKYVQSPMDKNHFRFLLNFELYSLIGLFLIVKQIKTIIAIQIYRVINNN